MNKKLNTVMLLALICTIAAAVPTYASMNLEADAPVSGISVALNNYFARNEKPEEALADSVKMVASETIELGDVVESEKNAVTRLVEDVTPVQEEIVTDEDVGVTWGTVKDTASLRLRDKPNSSAKTLTLLAKGEHYIVTGQEGQFLKIQVDDDLEGYVFKDYIDTSISYNTEMTEEEKAALQADADRRKAEADEAMRKLEEARKAEQEKTEKDKKKETQAETKKETKAETIAETKSETKAETKAETIAETKSETKTPEKVEAKPESSKASETKKTEAETIEALNWDDGEEETDEEKEAETDDEEEEEAEAPDEEEETEEEVEETKPKSTVASNNAGPSGVTSATRTAMVAYAKQFLGNPYVYGGTSLTNGCDCSGFTMQIYKNFGISIARNSSAQASQGTEISAGSAQPGDLFFYDSGGAINHVAMYIGGNQVIHASTTTTGIIISNAYYRTPCKVCTYIR